MKMMNRQSKNCKYLANTLYTYLEMDRHLIGVRFLYSADEYQTAAGRELQKPINYCQMVASASKGNSIKVTRQQIKCVSGVRVLGFDHTDEKNSQGENWTRLGMYEDPQVSREVRHRIGNIPEQTYGIQIQPAENYEQIPDVVIAVTEPYNLMRLLQGYGYYHGEADKISMMGNQAICLECTAAPYLNDDINLSVLCIGTRHQAGWKDSEMAMGISGEKFADVVSGVVKTMNMMESDARKKVIECKFKETDFEHEEIRYGYNYYMDC